MQYFTTIGAQNDNTIETFYNLLANTGGVERNEIRLPTLALINIFHLNVIKWLM